MKRIIIAVLIFSLPSVFTYAQGFKLGIKAGANFTKIDGASFKDEFSVNYHAGAFAEIDLTKTLGIQPEVLFSQSQGTTVASGSSVTPPNTSYSLNYLSIPILLRYKLANVFVLNAGPQYSILLNNNDNLVTNGKNAFKQGDFALVLGAQVEMLFLRVYARYNIGLSNISDIDNSDNWKSQQIQAGVGFKF